MIRPGYYQEKRLNHRGRVSMQDFIHGLLVLTVVHFLAAALPGPDFVFVSRQTLVHGKRAGILCSIGIALGLSVHIAYSFWGMAALVAHSTELLFWVKIGGGSYLIYLGIKGLRSGKPAESTAEQGAYRAGTPLRMISSGFICNVLNPKAPVYFLSLFTLVLSPGMPFSQVLVYGIWIMLIQLGWFSFVTLVLSIPSVNRQFQRAGCWINRLLGGTLILLGLRLLIDRKS